MKNFNKYLSIILLTLTLTACGGGGDSGGTPSGGTTGGGGTTTDQEPTLSLSASSVQLNELVTSEVSITTSDPDGDVVTITSSSNSDAITVYTNDENTILFLKANEVTENTDVVITVTATANGKSVTETLNVQVMDVVAVVTDIPLIVFDNLDESSVITEVSTFSYSMVLPDGAESFSISADYDLNNVTVSFESEGMVVTPLATGEATVTINITDNLDNSSSTELSLNLEFIDEFPDNTPPELNLSGATGRNITVYANTENTISVGLYDADGDDVVWQVSSLKLQSFDEEDLHLFLESYLYDAENNKIQLKLKDLPLNETVVWFDLKIAFTDGTETSTKDYVLSMVLAPNGAPVIKFEGAINGVIPVQIGTTRTFKYTIIDDEPEKVDITGFSFWSGDETLYTVVHSKENKEFTITHNGTDTGDQVGLSVAFKDQSSDGYYSLELMSTVLWGAWQQEQIDYLQDLRYQLATTTEYSYIAEFYVDVLENTGELTEEAALNFKRAALANDYDSNAGYEYGSLIHSITVLELYVKLGWYTEESEVEATKSTISSFLPLVLADKGRGNLAVVNELATMSSGLLPNLTFESSIDKYNDTDGYYSHFTNNPTYGSLNGDGVWIFNPTYRFLQAIIEKSTSQVEQKYVAQ